MALFSSELQNPNTKLFILDTGRIEHRDIDFEMYSWNKHRYNLVEPGNLFIYRKPQKVSENGKFYFFGAGKIESISEVSPDACFEKGFITIDSDYKVRVSDQAEKDPALYDEISKYDGVKINLPKIKENRPAKRFLLEHQNRVS